MATTRQIDISDESVERLQFTKRGERVYHDRRLPGFSVRVGKTTKTFSAVAEHWRDGARVGAKRMSLGRFGQVSAADARGRADAAMRSVRKSGDANLPSDPSAVTLGDAWRRFKQSRIKIGLSARTIEEYESKFDKHLAPWHSRSLGSISRAEAIERHEQITKTAGPFAGNGALRVARAIWNFCDQDLEMEGLQKRCPFRARGLYHEEQVRAGGMASPGLPAWAAELRKLPTLRQALHCWTLLTGMREASTFEMEWSHVDWANKLLHVPKPKGGREAAYTIPLSRPALLLLRFARRTARRLYWQDHADLCRRWVWPSPKSKTGHSTESKERHLSCVSHGLRKSFGTILEEVGVVGDKRKVLLGHKKSRDVTDRHYLSRAALGHEYRIAQEKAHRLIVTTLLDGRRARNFMGAENGPSS
jgi:integrase